MERAKERSRRERIVFGVSIFALLTVAPTPVSGEWFADLYVGASFTQNADVSVEEFAPSFTPASAQRTVAFDPSFTYGGRLGYWLKWVPWLGLAGDASFFRANGKGVDIDLVPLSGLLMLRWSLLTTDEFPYGRLQPYAGIGGSVFIVPEFDVDFRPTVSQKMSTSSAEFGLDTRAGLAWQFHRHLALFVEYRFTHVGIGVKESRCVLNCDLPLGVALARQPVEQTQRTLDATLNTHHILFGLSFRF